MSDTPKKSRIERLRDLHDNFSEAHRDGMASLEKRDYAEFGEAIERERQIIEEQEAVAAEEDEKE